MSSQIFHPDFNARPFWWEAYAPEALAPIDLPKEVSVAIVGAGYAGLSAALALNDAGHRLLVLDANEPGFGASTRNGGMVSGGVNVGKRYLAKPTTARRGRSLSQRRCRSLHLHRKPDRAREDRLSLDQGRLFPRRLVPKPLSRHGEEDRRPQCQCAIGCLYRAAREASARRSAPTTIAAAWWSSAPLISTLPSITRVCSISSVNGTFR